MSGTDPKNKPLTIRQMERKGWTEKKPGIFVHPDGAAICLESTGWFYYFPFRAGQVEREGRGPYRNPLIAESIYIATVMSLASAGITARQPMCSGLLLPWGRSMASG